MKLYPKKLDSLDALRKEKHRLRNEIQSTGFPALADGNVEPGKYSERADTTKQNEETGTEENDEILSSVLSFFGDTSSISPILEIAGPLIKRYTGKKISQLAWAVGKEILVGYAKWKAVEMSAKGVQRFMRNRKKKS